MKIMNKGLKKGYLIHVNSVGVYSVCIILNEYDNKDDATNDLVKVLCHKKKEGDLLREYTGMKENWFLRLISELSKFQLFFSNIFRRR